MSKLIHVTTLASLDLILSAQATEHWLALAGVLLSSLLPVLWAVYHFDPFAGDS